MLVTTMLLCILVGRACAERDRISASDTPTVGDVINHVDTTYNDYDPKGTHVSNQPGEFGDEYGGDLFRGSTPSDVGSAQRATLPVARSRERHHRRKRDANPAESQSSSESAATQPSVNTALIPANNNSAAIQPNSSNTSAILQANGVPGVVGVIKTESPETTEEYEDEKSTAEEQSPEFLPEAGETSTPEGHKEGTNVTMLSGTTEAPKSRTLLIVASVVVSIVALLAFIVIGVVLYRYRESLFGQKKEAKEEAKETSALKAETKPSDAKGPRKAKGVASNVAMALKQRRSAMKTGPGMPAAPRPGAPPPPMPGLPPRQRFPPMPEAPPPPMPGFPPMPGAPPWPMPGAPPWPMPGAPPWPMPGAPPPPPGKDVSVPPTKRVPSKKFPSVSAGAPPASTDATTTTKDKGQAPGAQTNPAETPRLLGRPIPPGVAGPTSGAGPAATAGSAPANAPTPNVTTRTVSNPPGFTVINPTAPNVTIPTAVPGAPATSATPASATPAAPGLTTPAPASTQPKKAPSAVSNISAASSVSSFAQPKK